MELFVNFCEDTIFEMQLAAQISATDRAEEMPGTEDDGVDEKKEDEEEENNLASDDDDTKREQEGFFLTVMMKRLLQAPLRGLMMMMMMIISILSIRHIKRQIQKMTTKGFILAIALFFQKVFSAIVGTVCFFLHVFYLVFLSGCVIEFAKETTLSDFFRDLPEPTLDDITGVNEAVTQKVGGDTQAVSSRGDLRAVTPDLSAGRNPQLLTDIFGLRLRKERGQYRLISQDSITSEIRPPSKYQVSSVQ